VSVWTRKIKRAPLKPNWPAINERTRRFEDLPVGAAARVDQAAALLRDFLDLSAIDLTDPRDLYCVAVGVAMVDTAAANWLERDDAISTHFVADIACTVVMPLIEDAGVLR
jgi:hypothetical protein